MVGNDVVVIGELLMADSADASLLSDFPVQELAYLSR